MRKIKVKTVLSKEVEIPVSFPKPRGAAWDRKPETENCLRCENFVSKQEAIPIINRLKKLETEWNPPEEEEIRGICISLDFPRILIECEEGASDCELIKIV